MNQLSVVAEWALWGKEPRDAEYRLLECSDSTLGTGSFTEVVTRYLPGTLEQLPQVTIGWVKDRDYVALAIHHTRHGLHDAGHRRIVFTSCFCIPYGELAEGAISYYEMYSGVKDHELQTDGRSPISIRLDHLAGIERPATATAMRVAALLLTSRPVCIMGADHVSMEERLRFLDSVMALLPYGMRIELSASTCVSSTADHLFRLFFADAPRPGNDHVVLWDQPGQGPIGHRYADDYLTWLTDRGYNPEALTASIEPVRFKQPEILKMLERMHVSYSPPAVRQPAPARTSNQSVTRWRWRGTLPSPAARGARASADGPITEPEPEPEREPTVEEVLRSCARRLDDGHPVHLDSDLNRLRAFRKRPVSAEDRSRYRHIIVETGLLRAGRPVEKKLQPEFYRMLLWLAFDPLSYLDFCALEDCAGRPLHRPLLDVIDPVGLPHLATVLLVLKARGHHDLRRTLRALRLPLSDLLAMATDRGLREDHARDLCEIVIEDLRESAGNLDRTALQQALAQHGYLALPLSKLNPDRPDHQHEQLGYLLQLVHRHPLDRRTAQEILDSKGHQPTAALFAAVLGMVGRDDAVTAERAFSRGFLANANFGRYISEQALRQLPMINGNAGGAPLALPPGQARRGKRRIPRLRFASMRLDQPFTPLFWLIAGIVLGVVLLRLGQVVFSNAAPAGSTPAIAVSSPAATVARSPSSPQNLKQPGPCGLVTPATLQAYLPGASELTAATPVFVSMSGTQTGNCVWTTPGAHLSMGYRIFGSGTAAYAYQSDIQSAAKGSSTRQVSGIGTQATAIFMTETGPKLSGSRTRQVVELLAWTGNAEIKVQIAYENRASQPPWSLAAVTAVARDSLAALSRS